MARQPTDRPPRTFFLNEQHELARGEKPGGGGQLKLGEINWQTKGERIFKTLATARQVIERSPDPVKERRFFLATLPTKHFPKRSDNKKRAPTGTYDAETDFSGEHSKVFRRLGMDLLAVADDGRAVVHAPRERVEQLASTAQALGREGPREQSRWVTIDAFETIPASFRVDDDWLRRLSASALVDAVFELQPVLTRLEVDDVVRALAKTIAPDAVAGLFTSWGTDFSGRHWYRGRLRRDAVAAAAAKFFSVQSIHPPLLSPVAAEDGWVPSVRTDPPAPAPPSRGVPTVGVVDTGVPANHRVLASSRRGGFQSPYTPDGIVSRHGSCVASRVVYGDPAGDPMEAGAPRLHATCAFFDINVAEDARHIDDKAVVPALTAVLGTAPDVRVFNLSFDTQLPITSHPPVDRRERLILTRDLDNFVFARDVLVIVAAGNTLPGVFPNKPYPDHADDPAWGLGAWSCGFNTLTCGSLVARPTPGGLATHVGAPSPFSRVGPGLCGSRIPEFAANGGNCTPNYAPGPGLGVWMCDDLAQWVNGLGTSLAAPLLARECAFAMAELQTYCHEGARPFAATVKAFLALTADPPVLPPRLGPLAERALGRGVAAHSRLATPDPASAVMVWQGVLQGPDDVARVQVPIPRAWLNAAKKPVARLIVSWEPPVNEAVEHLWAARRVSPKLRPSQAADALRGKELANHASYPMVDRLYDLDHKKLGTKKAAVTDLWLVELSYSEIAEYSPAMDFSPLQRVGMVVELLDAGEEPVGPQPAVQALPVAATMVRLTNPPNRIANPVVIRPRA